MRERVELSGSYLFIYQKTEICAILMFYLDHSLRLSSQTFLFADFDFTFA